MAEEGTRQVCITTIDPLSLSAGGPPEIDEQTGLPKKLQAFVVVPDPEVLVVQNFLSDAEMKHMLDLAENLWAPSGVVVGASRQKQVTKARTSYSCVFQPGHTQTVANVEARCAQLAGIGVEYLEQLALVRYEPGQYFNIHHDGDHRSKTVFIYLNDLPDEESGGETIFPNLGVQFTPRRGAAVMWNNIHPDMSEDSRLIHAGTAPLKGIKYGVNCFFNIHPLKVRGVIDGDMPIDLPSLVNTEAQDRKEWATIDPLQLAAESQLAPGQLQMFVHSTDPKMAVIPNCLSEDEAASLVKHHNRESNDDIPAEEMDLLRTIQTRLASIAGEPLENIQNFYTAKYKPLVVPDGLSHTGENEYCKKYGGRMLFVVLGGVQENQGGELSFPRLGLQVKPRTGSAVYWTTLKKDGQRCLSTAHQPHSITSGELVYAICTFGAPAIA